MRFYDSKGNLISLERFVEMYSKAYYIGVPKINGIKYTQTSKYVECEIVRIRDNHICNYDDVYKIMAWKMGKIKQKESLTQFVFHKDWDSGTKDAPRRYNSTIDIHRLSCYICREIDSLEKLAENNPQECLNKLKSLNITGIGTVYLITLLFILSHGKYPIYDRFAMAALEAGTGDKIPCKNVSIHVKALPGRREKGFDNLLEGQYKKYIDLLEEFKKEGFDYQKDRRVDQALWVYGHAFNTNNNC